MRGVRIPQDLNGEDHFVLGLSVPRLAALLLGLLAAYTIFHLALPAPMQLAGALLAAALGAAVAWVRPEGRSLIHWLAAAIEFKLARDDQAGLVPLTPPTNATQKLQMGRRSSAPRSPQLQIIASATPPVPERQLAIESTSKDVEDDVIELPEALDALAPDSEVHQPFRDPIVAPVYLGGPQLITFFSTKGGTGKTTLATEVALLLATKGFYRDSASAEAQPLRVALIDFNLGSANVSARLGLAQPTVLDYLCDASLQSPDPADFVVHHRTANLDVLLGPSKCLAGDRADLMGVAQAARILSSFKQAGYQFVILDIASALGDLETYLLETVTQIYCVVTPTASSIQSLYRGVEALRRMGLGPKLHYVANKMRDGVNLSEAMSDLNGSLAANVPYEPLFDTAENRHHPLALQHPSTATASLLQLAASIYPALEAPAAARAGLSPLNWLMRRRRAG